MRKTAFVGTLFIASVLLNGCIIVSSNKTQTPPETCPAPTPQTNATIAEIDAVSKLASDSARARIYKAIAERPGLSPQERIHLTKAVTTHLASHSDREKVLMALVNNHPPVPQPASKQPVSCTAETEDAAPNEAAVEK